MNRIVYGCVVLLAVSGLLLTGSAAAQKNKAKPAPEAAKADAAPASETPKAADATPAPEAPKTNAAPAAETPKAYKIGVVNRKEVFDTYKKTKDEYAKLQAEVAKNQKVVDELSTKIEAQKKEYDAKKDTMTPEVREEMEVQIQNDYGLYKSELTRLQRSIDNIEQRVVKNLFAEIDKAITQLGAEGNYHLILDATPNGPASVVIYYSPTLNMTQRVAEFLNQKQ